jgi:signal transduction histidine kinase
MKASEYVPYAFGAVLYLLLFLLSEARFSRWRKNSLQRIVDRSTGATEARRLREEQATARDRELEAISEIVTKTVRDQFRSLLDRVESLPSSHSPDLTKPKTPSVFSDQQMMREVSHSLSTPLSQVDVALERIRKRASDAPMTQSIIAAQQSIQLSRAVVAAYRDVASIVRGVSRWDVKDLETGINAAFSVHSAGDGDTPAKNVSWSVSVNLVERSGHTNYFLLAVLLPLVQNAVEASPSGSEVICSVDSEDHRVVLIVDNAVTARPNVKRIREGGYTSKAKRGHEGLGLSSVRTLIASVSSSQVDFAYDQRLRRFAVTVTLPLRHQGAAADV